MSNCTVEVLDQGYDQGQEMLNWAKTYCPSLITNSANIVSGLLGTSIAEYTRVFYFGNEQDATLFRLKWA